ncbi:MAG: hypothetical protein CVU50_09845 [Candidatus Cloacimonetes bacterium HGW-Cloacimonetes-3]|nr:MAG: hypothetical protein CVU50_09845 [Candidatus Cloacimonetes bacterium HGW-Cloacimonetes-3]
MPNCHSLYTREVMVKNKLMLLFLACLLLTWAQLFAVNQMELIHTLYGEFNGARFGNRVVAMDYNADGYDDLIVSSIYWNPTGEYSSNQGWGKLYFYWGGPNMDNIPDFVMEGTRNWELYPANPKNGGDINGDGIDDLVITLPVGSVCVIAVYYGKATPTGIPDETITIPFSVMDYISATPLGDINGDGRADMVIHTEPWETYGSRLIIWTGNETPFHTLIDTDNGSVSRSAIGVGDVNGDEVDDYLLQYGLPGGTNMDSRIVLYYGSTNFPEVDSLVISDNTNAITLKYSSPLGDLNNDGYADFETYVGKVWLGGTDLTPNNDFELTYNYQYHDWGNPGYNVLTPFIHGDLNGDGYDEVIGSSYLMNYYRGEVGIWIGGPNMDGLIDLYLYPPSDYETRHFGYAKAAGDFNGDGLCDIAVSAPMYYGAPQWATGRVFIYSGNTALSDPVVANDDLLSPSLSDSLWDIGVSPNPIGQTDQLRVELIGSGYKTTQKIALTVYNIKGQRIYSSIVIGNSQAPATHTITLTEQAAGIYLISTSVGGKPVITKKISIIK